MLDPRQLAALRAEYSERGLRRAALDADPIAQFKSWLAEAVARELIEPNAMTLSTVDQNGQPWCRVVLLKACDQRGFVFFTNFEGAKGRQLIGHPLAALTFWWGALERQVNVTGEAAVVSRDEAEAYFRSRPVSSQLGAWASNQSEVIPDRATLEKQFEAARAEHGEENVPMPPHWGGFCVRPQTIEFWQGRRSRLHDRFRYTREESGGWSIARLAP
jgi:pyridoxamine 5'-phosphate oxidase